MKFSLKLMGAPEFIDPYIFYSSENRYVETVDLILLQNILQLKSVTQHFKK